MKKKDFTDEFVAPKVEDYLMNHDFPHDELDEIGFKVFLDSVIDVEIDSVTSSRENFIVKGTANIETETDMGDGDLMYGTYPMSFAYEFDEDGNIIEQLKRHIDTSSFFEGNDLDDYRPGSVSSEHKTPFEMRLSDIRTLLADSVVTPRECLHRLLYINVITVIESYLSDFFISRLTKDEKLVRKMIEGVPTFQEQKVSVSEIFRAYESVQARAKNFLSKVMWHRLDEVASLYAKVLGIEFPHALKKPLNDAVLVRHDLVHHSGKRQDGTEHVITELQINSVIKAAEELVNHIEAQWQPISS
jgi:hypothetical protein